MAKSPLTYEMFRDRFNDLNREGEFAQALDLIEREGPRFSENDPKIIAWRSAILSRLGRLDDALQALKTAEARGYWYDEEALRGDSDFEALLEHPEFASLLERMGARRLSVAEYLSPARKVVEPSRPGPHPLFLALHGNNSSLSMSEPLWRPVVKQNYVLAALQSSQPGWATGTYVWNDTAKSLAEVKKHYLALKASRAVNAQQVIAGGFSMGAQIALRMALDPAFDLRGVIAVEAWFTERAFAEFEQIAASAPPTELRVVLIVGQENTEYVLMTQKVEQLLTGRGFACQVVYSSNPRHGYPDEFAQLLQEALETF